MATDKSKEAMKLALEALENIEERCTLGAWEDDAGKAITALREALAEQPAQKCSYPYCGCNSKAWCKVERNEALDKKAENARELGLDYEPARDSGIVTAGGADPRTQRTWVGLTDEERKRVRNTVGFNQFVTAGEYAEHVQKATEAKLKEKNT